MVQSKSVHHVSVCPSESAEVRFGQAHKYLDSDTISNMCHKHLQEYFVKSLELKLDLKSTVFQKCTDRALLVECSASAPFVLFTKFICTLFISAPYDSLKTFLLLFSLFSLI